MLIKQSSIEGLGKQPVGYQMVRIAKLKVFQPLPCLVERFKRPLLESLQLCPDLRGLAWRIEFGQKAIGQFFLSPIYTSELGLEPGLGLILQTEGKKPHTYRLHGQVLGGNGVTPFSEVCDMVMGTFTGVTSELVSLNHLDEVRLQFKVFCTEIRFDDTWNGSLGERGRTQLAKGLVSIIGHLVLLSP